MNSLIKIAQPRIPVQLTTTTFDEIDHESYYTNCQFKDCTLSNRQLESVCFQHVAFINVTFDHCRFTRFECLDVTFEGCNISNNEWIGGTFHRIAFKDTKLLGTNFAESSIVDAHFDHCIGNYSSFNYASMKLVRFQDSSLIESEFFEVKWKKLDFVTCQLDRMSIMRTNLNGLNLSDSEFESLAVSIDLVKGCKLNAGQALIIAHSLGILIV